MSMPVSATVACIKGFLDLVQLRFFYGRKANENVKQIQNIGELYTALVSEKSYAAWKERIKNLRNDTEGRQKLARDKIISQYGNKFPPSVYELGDKMLVKMKISGKKIRGEHKMQLKWPNYFKQKIYRTERKFIKLREAKKHHPVSRHHDRDPFKNMNYIFSLKAHSQI